MTRLVPEVKVLHHHLRYFTSTCALVIPQVERLEREATLLKKVIDEVAEFAQARSIAAPPKPCLQSRAQRAVVKRPCHRVCSYTATPISFRTRRSLSTPRDLPEPMSRSAATETKPGRVPQLIDEERTRREATLAHIRDDNDRAVSVVEKPNAVFKEEMITRMVKATKDTRRVAGDLGSACASALVWRFLIAASRCLLEMDGSVVCGVHIDIAFGSLLLCARQARDSAAHHGREAVRPVPRELHKGAAGGLAPCQPPRQGDSRAVAQIERVFEIVLDVRSIARLWRTAAWQSVILLSVSMIKPPLSQSVSGA